MQEKIELLRSAIRELKQVTGTCNGYPREFCPHVLGQKGAKWSVLVWQFAGLSESSLRPDGDWRCFELDDLEHLAKRDGDWHTQDEQDEKGTEDRGGNHCFQCPSVRSSSAGARLWMTRSSMA